VDSVQTAFSGFGNVTNIVLKEGRNFAIVIFSDKNAVAKCLEAPPATVNGNSVKVEARNPKEKPPAKATVNVYVNKLPADTTEEHVRTALAAFGEVVDLVVQAERGFAYATFAELSSAQKLIDAAPVNINGAQAGAEFRRSRAPNRVTRSRKPRQSRKPKGPQIYVKGLDENTDESSLRAAFGGFGEIVKVEKRDNRDYAFIQFETKDQVTDAVSAGENNGIKVNGVAVIVEERTGKPRNPRQSRADEA
jgi:RNA recognition motif-containing protein